MSFYRRRLPHWEPKNAAIVLTWCLHGSLPAPPREWQHLPAGRRFTLEDRSLDDALGPRVLADARVADAVANVIRHGAEALNLYDLHAWVVMPNHVHLLIDPKVPLAQVTKTIKGYSARKANEILDRTGDPFWAIESYDHWVRDLKEFNNIARYIECNPVKAGLAQNPEDWRSSAGLETCATGVRHER